MPGTPPRIEALVESFTKNPDGWTVSVEAFRSLLEAPSPAVLTTYRVERDVTPVREAIAARYLGEEDGKSFAATRASRRGFVLRLVPDEPRVWDLAAVLP
jgi:hypothetical protein